MTDLPQGAVIERRSDLLSNDLSDAETVMLDIAEGTYFGVRDVAKAIWDLLEQPRTLTSLCDELTEAFEVDRDTCARETAAFVRELDERGLVEVRTP